MRRRSPRQLSMPFDSDVPAVLLPPQTTQELVNALADLLLASVRAADDDEERDDACEDHR